MNQLQSKINIRSEEFKTNQAAMLQLVDDLKQKVEKLPWVAEKLPVRNIWIAANYCRVNGLII